MKLALITGASAGIGAAFAEAYAKRGLDVVLVARRADRLEQLSSALRQTYGVSALALPADLSNPKAHATILAEIEGRGRSVDVLVNNAGFGISNFFSQTEWSAQEAFLTVSITNLCGLIHGVVPGMISRGMGNIINMSSVVALAPELAGYSLYPAAKSFSLKFSRSLSAEVRSAGVSVTAVCAGYTPTEFHRVSGTSKMIEDFPRFFVTSAEFVAEASIRANERGKAMVIPGWHNKLAASLMRYLPGRLVEPVVRAFSTKYRPHVGTESH
jgi:uncharacterized protein